MYMNLYDKLLHNNNYLETVKKIENIRFITDDKWDWEHGLGHFKRVAKYTKDILSQLNADERTIELGITTALLHDIGLIKGDKTNHALESSKIFINYLDKDDISKEEEETMKLAIADHSKGNNIKSIIGLALVLADKLDVTYHRTESSTIQDTMNKEIKKIKKVDIKITNEYLIINYTTDENFNLNILRDWPKAIIIPYKASKYLNRKLIFKMNENNIDISGFINN